MIADLAPDFHPPAPAAPMAEEDWSLVKGEERQRIVRLAGLMHQIGVEVGRRGARALRAICRQVALHQGWVRGGARTGLSPVQLRRYYLAWEECGRHWTALRRNYKAPALRLPSATAKHLCSVAMQANRPDAARAAYESFCRAWLGNEPIPGLGRLTDWWPAHRPNLPLPRGPILRPTDLPPGASLSTFYRLLPRRRVVRKLTQRGFFAAHGGLPQLLRDRSKLRPLELVAFDDHRLDLKAMFWHEGREQIAYVNCIFAIDVATGTILHWGLMPRWEREDKTKMGLSPEHVRIVFCGILEKYGIPPYPMHVLLENATATFTKEDEAAFGTLLGSRIVIEHTRMWKKQLTAGGFAEEGGSPWQKGWIEALFRVMETNISALGLGGATGRRYDDDPGRLAGECEYTLALMKRAAKTGVSPTSLKLPILAGDEAEEMLAEIVGVLNRRQFHRLQGFDSVREWRDGEGQWHRLEHSDPPVGTEIVSRRELPAERFLKLLRELFLTGERFTAAPACALHALAAEKHKVTVRNGAVALAHKRFGNDPLIFQDLDRPLAAKFERREFTAFLSHDRMALHLLTPAPELVYAATLPRRDRFDVLDQEAQAKESGRVHRARQALYDEAAELLAPLNARMGAMRAHNEAAFARAGEAGAAMQEAEDAIADKRRRAARQRAAAKAEAGTLQDLVHAPCSAPATASAAPAEEDPGSLADLL